MEETYVFYEALELMQKHGKRMKEADFVDGSYWFFENGGLLACRQNKVDLVPSVPSSMINYGV